MNVTKLQTQIEGLRHMTVGQLKEQYRALFNEESRSNHKQFLFRRVPVASLTAALRER